MHASSSPSQNGSSYTFSGLSHGFTILQWLYRESTLCSVYLHRSNAGPSLQSIAPTALGAQANHTKTKGDAEAFPQTATALLTLPTVHFHQQGRDQLTQTKLCEQQARSRDTHGLKTSSTGKVQCVICGTRVEEMKKVVYEGRWVQTRDQSTASMPCAAVVLGRH